jgi:hypothetical protein
MARKKVHFSTMQPGDGPHGDGDYWKVSVDGKPFALIEKSQDVSYEVLPYGGERVRDSRIQYIVSRHMDMHGDDEWLFDQYDYANARAALAAAKEYVRELAEKAKRGQSHWSYED